MTTIVTGLKPTGRMTIGNYLGAVRPLHQLHQDLMTPDGVAATTLVFVADLHAMTVPHDPALLRERTREMATTLLACGVGDMNESSAAGQTLFVQSAVPAHTELAYLMECTAHHGEMTRMIQFKEKAGRGTDAVQLSLLTYPALMAADILLYQADLVPVGEDQRQHLELTRDLAQRFNRTAISFGADPVFTVPQAHSPDSAARLRDLRDPGAKMGKSGVDSAGVIHVLDTATRIAQVVRRAVTDLDPMLSYDPELRPGVANLAELLGTLTGRTPDDALRGLRGAGALKAAVTEALIETLRPIRARYTELAFDPDLVDRILADGAQRARSLAHPTLTAARTAVGLPSPLSPSGV